MLTQKLVLKGGVRKNDSLLCKISSILSVDYEKRRAKGLSLAREIIEGEAYPIDDAYVINRRIFGMTYEEAWYYSLKK